MRDLRTGRPKRPAREFGKLNIWGILGTFLDTFVKVAIIALVVMYTIRFAGDAYQFGYRLFSEEPPAKEPGIDIEVTIPLGSDARQIGKILEQRGLIKDANLFFVQELISDYRGKLSAGTYTLNNSWTADQIMAAMVGEDTSDEETTEAVSVPAAQEEEFVPNDPMAEDGASGDTVADEGAGDPDTQ